MMKNSGSLIVELERSKEDELEFMVKKIAEGSRGWIDAIVVMANGNRIIFSENDRVDPMYIADVAFLIAETAASVMELFNSKKLDELDVQLQGDRYLMIKAYERYLIAVLTKPNPNLGLIKLVFNKYLV